MSISRLSYSVSLPALAFAAFANPAYAQTDAQAQAQPDNVTGAAQGTAPTTEGDQAIVVTGSRIRRPNFDSPQPTVVLGGEQIEERGYTNLADALEELPAFGLPGNTPVGG